MATASGASREDRAAPRSESVKDPQGDAATPASMPAGADAGQRKHGSDPAGQQGGTKGGGKDRSAV